jgi:hypothetical protein
MKALSVVLALLALIATAFAQQAEITIEKVGLTLLLNPKIQTELKMTKAQSDFIKNEFVAFNKRTQGMFTAGMTEAQKRQKVLELRKIQDGVSGRILKSLSATQKARLRQITLQAEGIWAVLIPEATRALKLTPTQVQKIRGHREAFAKKAEALQMKRRAEINAIPGPKDAKDKAQVDAYREKVKAVLARVQGVDKKSLAAWAKTAMTAAEKELTVKQRADWKQMLGPKFSPK